MWIAGVNEHMQDSNLLDLFSGLVLFAVVFFFCFVILYPNRGKHLSKCFRGKPFQLHMKEETKYGIVEDSADGVELMSQSAYKDDDLDKTLIQKQVEESMI